MKKWFFVLSALSAYGTDCVISDVVRTPFGGYFAGKITVVLNSPSLAQPLYSGSQTLTGWQTTIDVPASANGAVAVTLVCTDSITPSGTSYAARYQPTSGAGWAETWTPATGTTTIRAMRSTTVPSPTVTFQPSQLALAAGSLLYGSSAGVGTSLTAGTNGHILTLSGGYPSWATPAACATCVVTSGSYADPAWITSLAGSKITGGLVSGITGTANQITASASTGAVTLSLPATITGLTSVTSTGFTGALTGNASTATALAANPAACAAGQYVSDIAANGDLTCAQVAYSQLSGTSGVVTGAASLTTVGAIPYVTSSGVLGQDAGALFWDATNDRLGVGTNAPGVSVDVIGTIRSLRSAGTAPGLQLFQSGIENWTISNVASVGNLTISASGSTAMTITPSLNTFIGGTSDGNYKFSVNTSGSTGTLRVFDQTATTGSTLAVIQAGQGQSTNLQEWQNSAGTILSRVDSFGSMFSAVFQDVNDKFSVFTGSGLFLDSGSGVTWSSTSAQSGSKDAGVARAGVGFVKITNGSSGLGKIVVSQSTPAASSDACTAGALWADTTYIYACTASGAIKRATLSTF